MPASYTPIYLNINKVNITVYVFQEELISTAFPMFTVNVKKETEIPEPFMLVQL